MDNLPQIGAFVTLFGAVCSALVVRGSMNPLDVSAASRRLMPIVSPLGVIAGFLSIYMFIMLLGLGRGLLFWVIGGVAATIVARIVGGFAEGFLSILSILTILIGAALYFGIGV